ncbi:MAG TPA: cupin domain-containing protein [Gemmatimonadales bacterium]|nr:cupin domain-containing protein [Gemmatimonadales bacterium]
MDDRSKVLKFRDYRWDAVPVREYKSGDVPYKDVTRQTLLGEATGEEPFTFLTRYFEIQPGGYSTLERHQHPHAVVVIRGRGQVTLGERTCDLAPFDCIYVSPGVPHQFRATGREPLGFLCTVDRVRDRPEVVS